MVFDVIPLLVSKILYLGKTWFSTYWICIQCWDDLENMLWSKWTIFIILIRLQSMNSFFFSSCWSTPRFKSFKFFLSLVFILLEISYHPDIFIYQIWLFHFLIIIFCVFIYVYFNRFAFRESILASFIAFMNDHVSKVSNVSWKSMKAKCRGTLFSVVF